MPQTVEKLTAAMSAGDSRAVEAFYRRYFDDLYSHASRFTGRDESFCLDVVQEAVLRIIRSVRPVRSEAQFAAWLRLVVQTAAYDLLRSESRRRRREMAVAIAPGSATSEGDHEPIDAQRLSWLAARIAELDEQIVRMIDMRFQRKWTLASIASAMGLSIGTVDGRLRRALRQLRRLAAEQNHERSNSAIVARGDV